MYIQTNAPLVLDDLFCTDKAQRSIKNFTNDLTGRERQLLILMSSNSKLCAKACARLLSKVDLNDLIARGYLAEKGQNQQEAFAHTTSNMPVPVVAENDEPEAFLRLVAGNF